ncbi:MAG: hypothetical protein A2Y17_04165 [Clostridiales bacterium GWF2_38_85]|nr:MAG: hypothetical protein A2Y17_04165 [Clostridiales bacterium GWF2_38_85]HBL83453.1 adenosine deaminase [Clostridiales bacterium]
MSNEFVAALQNRSLDELILFHKSDLHSHAGRSGKVDYIAKWANVNIDKPPNKFDSISHMQTWYNENIKKHCSGFTGQLKRWEAGFVQASMDNITVLSMSFSNSEINFVGGMESFINILKSYNETFAPKTLFLPELTFDRACNVNNECGKLEEILSYNYFKSIDVCCDEFAQPIKNFIPLYKKAKEQSLRLKAHIGEFGTADDVMEAVEELELDEVHHGIAAAKSEFVMNWLSRHKIQLNICPTSNVMLGIVEDYKYHPIKTLYHAGIPVTVNTDDLLIMNQSISDEYLNLFISDVMTANELDDIRINGLGEKNHY